MRWPMLVAALILLFGHCKKNHAAPPDDIKIVEFVLKKSVNTGLTADVSGSIMGDTIILIIPAGTSRTSLIPDISYIGSGISPGSHIPVNFTNPQTYRVSAQDGSSKTYIIIVRNLSTVKSITSFTLKASDNPAVLNADVIGIIGTDTIELQIPVGTPLQALVPAITYTGKLLQPVTGQAQDFSKRLQYRVQAEDSSFKLYTVLAGMNLNVYVGSNDSYVYALNAITGRLKWKFATGGAVYSSPSLQDGVVFVGSTDRYLYAIDAASGSLKWKTSLQDSIISSPTVSNGVVYITTGKVFAVNAQSGNIIWSSADYGSGLSSPTVSQSKLYFGQPSHGVYCLNTATGAVAWHYDAGIVRSNPALVNGVLYFGGEREKIIAMDAATGAFKWSSNTNLGCPGSPTIYNQTILIGTYDLRMCSFNTVTGKENWNFSFTGGTVGRNGLYYSTVVGNGIAYSANSDGYVYAFDAVSSLYKWRYGTASHASTEDYKSIANITYANGMTFTGSYDGNVYALNAATGEVGWQYTTGGAVYSGPCIIDTRGTVAHPGISGDQQ